MQETEIKILEIDKDAMIVTLEKLGASFVSESVILAHFYKNSEGKKLRVRQINNQVFVTYKENISKEKVTINQEYEFEVSDFDNLINTLFAIGFVKYRESIKRRIKYSFESIIYDFDKYDGIPWFVEVEAQSIHVLDRGLQYIGCTIEDGCLFNESQLKEYYGVL